jgi:hypothetical protein
MRIVIAVLAPLVLDLATSGRAGIKAAIAGHTLGSAELTGTYGR